MMKQGIYMVAAALLIALALYFRLAGTAYASDAFMGALTFVAVAILLIPIALKTSQESGQQ